MELVELRTVYLNDPDLDHLAPMVLDEIERLYNQLGGGAGGVAGGDGAGVGLPRRIMELVELRTVCLNDPDLHHLAPMVLVDEIERLNNQL